MHEAHSELLKNTPKYPILTALLTPLILVAFQVKVFFGQHPHDSNLLLITFSIFALLSFLSLRNIRNPDKRIFLMTIGCFCVIAITSLIWTYALNSYTSTEAFSGDIFRGPFHRFYGPLYGIRQNPTLDPFINIPLMLITLLCAELIFIRKRLGEQDYTKEIILCLIGLILLFGYTDGLERFLSRHGHFGEIEKDLVHFSSFSALLKNYVAAMPNLSTHNGHYPPGNLILFFIEHKTVYNLSKIVVILCSALTLLPLKVIAKRFGANQTERNYLSLFFITSAPVLVFSTIALTPIPMFLALVSVAYFIKTLDSPKIMYPILLGISISALLFFSFIGAVLILFLCILGGYHLLNKKDDISTIFRRLSVAVLTFLSLYILLFMLTGFNLWECFTTARAHNKVLMGQTSFDHPIRHLLRSFGNIIAFVGILGSPLVVLLSLSFRTQAVDQMHRHFMLALFVALFVATFGGLFYCETERIWLFFVPLVVLSALPSIKWFCQNKCFAALIFLIYCNVALGFAHEVFLDHSYGYLTFQTKISFTGL